MASSARPRVLVIRGGAVGDFILTIPAIRLIRENIPDVHLEVLGYEPIIMLAKEAGLAEEIRSLEHASMARLFAPGAAVDSALVDYLKTFNLIVSYLYDPDGYFKGNLERIGVKTFLEMPHRVEAGKGHAAVQLAQPLEKLAMFLDDAAEYSKLDFKSPSLSDVAENLPLLAIHPGSGSLLKNWPIERWLSFGSEVKGVKLALITGEAERERGMTDAFLKSWQGLDYSHWDQLPLPELGRRLSRCSGFIGHDSGISHLAAACGLPCLLFFGPTDPATWAPPSPKVEVFVEPSGDLGRLSFQRGRDVIHSFVASRIQKGL